MRKRVQKSGNARYYFEIGGHPRREIPLGGDYEIALAKWAVLSRRPEEYTCLAPAHCLYRHFDSNGILLYVGISLNSAYRQEQHRKNSAWFYSIARIEVERFASRDEASAAERAAIKSEFPLFNLRLAHEKRIRAAKALRADRAKVKE